MPDTQLVPFVQRIRAEFPGFIFQHAAFAGQGADHVVLLIDNEWIFRFRKDLDDTTPLAQEISLLEALREKVNIAVPNYEYVSHAKDFAGYRIIKGTDLDCTAFALLSVFAKETIVHQLADFLSVMHSLPVKLILENGLRKPHIRDPKFYAKRYAEKRRSVIAPHISKDLLQGIDSFFGRFVDLEIAPGKITHADLQADHMLLSLDKNSLAGIIDFTDAKISDPARDFGFFWGYGDDIVHAIYGAYQFHEDNNFLERSKWHACRLFADRVHYDVTHDEPEDLGSDKDILEKMIHLVVQ